MARMIPSSRPLDFHGSVGEGEVWRALSGLDDRFTVFHSLRWVVSSRSEGEADFVVMHPALGMLVIEVKSGEIEYRGGVWTQTGTVSRETNVIKPFEQAESAMHVFRSRISGDIPDAALPLYCFCAWFPSVVVPDDADLPPEAPRGIVLDARSLDDPTKAIERVFAYWGGVHRRRRALDDGQFRRAVNSLCPRFHVVPSLRTQSDEVEREYIRLTGQQAALLDFLDEQDTAVIHGPAGTGKTVLAVQKAQRLAERGDSVLLLCFNILLRDALASSVSLPGVAIHHTHSLSHELIGNTQTPVEKVLPEFIEYLRGAFTDDDWPYRSVVVDEGQDIDEELLALIADITARRGGSFYVFYDRNQNILKNKPPKWLDEAECRLVVRRNCRTTAEIFRSSCGVVGIPDPVAGEVHGDLPRARLCRDAAAQDKVISDFIAEMTAGGLKPEDIVVLTASTTERSTVDTGKRYAGLELSTDGGLGKVRFTSIRKFKGLEAEAVLITDLSLASLAEREARCLLYVGASRARSRLCAAIKDDLPRASYAEFMESLSPGSAAPRNLKGLAQLLGMTITE